MNRRAWLKWAAAAPVYGVIAARAATESLAAATGSTATGEVYRRLGVRPFINARGTWTYLSGSLELPEVRRAMDDAARHFVDIFELQQAAGRKLAELSGAESGMVTSGAAGAMAAATAGCMAGTDPEKVWQLPDTTGMKNEVVMLGGRSAFDSAIRLDGRKAGPRRAASTICRRTQRSHRDGVHHVARRTADSGPGRHEEGRRCRCCSTMPRAFRQSRTSRLRRDGHRPVLLLRRQGTLRAAVFRNPARPQGSDRSGARAVQPLGRRRLPRDEGRQGRDRRRARGGGSVDETATSPRSTSNGHGASSVSPSSWRPCQASRRSITIPEGGNSYPTLTVSWDQDAFGFTVADCDRELRAGEPRIEVLTSSNPSFVPAAHEGMQAGHKPTERRPDRLQIISMTMKDGEELIVGRRLRDILNHASRR